MPLTDNIDTTKTTIRDAVVDYMAGAVTIAKPQGMSDADYRKMLADMREGYKKLGNAVACALVPIIDHFKTNATIQTEGGVEVIR